MGADRLLGNCTDEFGRWLSSTDEEQIDAHLLTDHDMDYAHIGKFLKRTKSDELPQLVNVLKGDMHLVGPRALRPIFLEHLCDNICRYPIRLAVKPGMIGLAQVRRGYFTIRSGALMHGKRTNRPGTTRIQFAVGRRSASAELSTSESMAFNMPCQMPECALPLVKL